MIAPSRTEVVTWTSSIRTRDSRPQVDVRLQADGGRARVPEAGVEGLQSVLAEGGPGGMGVRAGAVVGEEQQVVGGARGGEGGEVEAPGKAHAAVLAQGVAVEMEAAEVADPPRVEHEAAVPGLPVGGNLEGGAVTSPRRAGRPRTRGSGGARGPASSRPAGGAPSGPSANSHSPLRSRRRSAR